MAKSTQIHSVDLLSDPDFFDSSLEKLDSFLNDHQNPNEPIDQCYICGSYAFSTDPNYDGWTVEFVALSYGPEDGPEDGPSDRGQYVSVCKDCK